MVSVTIAIASCGRDSLAATLSSIDQLTIPADWNVDLVIADDSLDGRAAAIVCDAAMSLPVRLRNVASRNVAIARNACLDMASGQFVVFIDDDEIAGPEWICQFVQEAIDKNADCLFAPVIPEYGPDAPRWIRVHNPLFPDEVCLARRGNTIVGRTGNSLLRRSFIESWKIRFNDTYGAGSEDLHFFALCHAQGANMGTTDRAAVREIVEPQRTSFNHVMRGCFGRGQGYARVMLSIASARFGLSLKLFVTSLAKLLISIAAAFVMLPLGPVRWIRFASSAASNLGKLDYLIRQQGQRHAGPAAHDAIRSRMAVGFKGINSRPAP